MDGDAFWQAICRGGFEVAPALAGFHQGPHPKSLHGRVSVETRRNPLISLILAMAGLPRPGTDLPLRLTSAIVEGKTVWRRDFGGQIMQTCMVFDEGPGKITEGLGPFTVVMALSASAGALFVKVERLKVFGIPLPRYLCPKNESREAEDDEGRFTFDISAEFPLLGQVIRYHGWLRPDVTGDEASPETTS